MRGVHQQPVECHIAGNVTVEVTVIMTTADFKCLAQGQQVIVGTPQRRQADGLDFENVPGLPGLLMGTAGQGLQGIQRIDNCPHVTAIALANLDQAGECQHAHGFAHRVAADAQFGAQLRLGRQALANHAGNQRIDHLLKRWVWQRLQQVTGLGIAHSAAQLEECSLRTGPGSSAQNAGLLSGDIVVAVNDQPIADSVDFRLAIAKAPISSSINLKYWRAHNFYTVPVLVASSGNPPPVLPLAARGSATPLKATSASLQGMSLGVVTPSYAKAVGLASAKGAWVTDTVKGSAADRAGIKPLDVIVEVSGQEVASAQDLADISSRMRAGYKATVSGWRNQAKRDVQMVLRNE